MANTIKLKQGSGSDPSASDLALGEPAVRTDTGEIFLKKDDGTIQKVAGTDDGNKGDITVSNSGTTFTVNNDAVTFDKIANVPTSRLIGRISSGTGSIETITATDVRTFLNVENGATADQTASEIRSLVESASDSNVFTDADHSKLNGIASGATNVTNTNQLTNGAGFITATLTNEQVQDIVGGMVSGNTESGITVTYQDGDGTLDFSVASQTDNNFTNADHSKLDGIEAGATADQTKSDIDGLGVNAATFTVADESSDTSCSVLFTTASSGNLAAKSGSNLTFNSSSGLLVASGFSGDGSSLSGLNASNLGSGTVPQARLSASTLLTLIKTVDGSGSGLDADTLDGISSASFLRSDTNTTATGDITVSGGGGALTVAANSDIRFNNGTWSGNTTKIQHHDNVLYIVGGTGGINFREAGTDRWNINGSGHFTPAQDSTYDIGTSSQRVSNGYFDTTDTSLIAANYARIANGIVEVKAAIATSYTLTSGFNAMAVSPTINSGVTVTVPSGAVLAII